MRWQISLLALVAGTLLAQEHNFTFARSIDAGPMRTEFPPDSIKGAPYSADVVTENSQVLGDGNRIVNRHTGFVARDSQGRSRNETGIQMLGPALANVKPERIVMIHDPVAQVTYTLESGPKTARKVFTGTPSEHEGMKRAAEKAHLASTGKDVHFMVKGENGMAGKETGLAALKEARLNRSAANVKKESLGTQVIEGVVAEGTRTTETIPAGEIGNEKDINIVNEVWTAQDLKAVILSKRTDPRTGEMSYRLTNIQRVEPAPSLFEVPADYKIVDGPNSRGIFYYKHEE